jgi:hypothetical protein
MSICLNIYIYIYIIKGWRLELPIYKFGENKLIFFKHLEDEVVGDLHCIIYIDKKDTHTYTHVTLLYAREKYNNNNNNNNNRW